MIGKYIIIFILLTYPYLIMWVSTLFFYKKDFDYPMGKLCNYNIIDKIYPVVSHYFSFYLLLKMFIRLVIFIIEIYYKNIYEKEDEKILNLIKIIDPFDEEDWDLKWVREIYKNKFYKFLNRI